MYYLKRFSKGNRFFIACIRNYNPLKIPCFPESLVGGGECVILLSGGDFLGFKY